MSRICEARKPSSFSAGRITKKIFEVEPLNNEYVAVKFLTWEESK